MRLVFQGAQCTCKGPGAEKSLWIWQTEEGSWPEVELGQNEGDVGL